MTKRLMSAIGRKRPAILMFFIESERPLSGKADIPATGSVIAACHFLKI